MSERITPAQAREALQTVDDCVPLTLNDKANGPLELLDTFIQQYEEMETSLEGALVYLEEAGLSRSAALLKFSKPTEADIEWAIRAAAATKGE